MELIADSLPPLKHLQIDPLNGWIFASSDRFELCRINLESFKVVYYTLPFELEHFSNHYHAYMLNAFYAKERAIYELSYDTRFKELKSWEVSSHFQGDVLWFQLLQDWLILSNGSHLLRQHLNSQEVDVLVFKEIEWCWKLIPLMSQGLKDRSYTTFAQTLKGATKPTGCFVFQ